MARENFDQIDSYPAAGDLHANGRSFVSLNGAMAVAATAAGAIPDGILDNPADVTAANKLARVVHRRNVRVKVKAGGTLAVGDGVSVGANGSAVKSVTTGHKVIGKALTAAASGEIVEVYYAGSGVYADIP